MAISLAGNNMTGSFVNLMGYSTGYGTSAVQFTAVQVRPSSPHWDILRQIPHQTCVGVARRIGCSS